ncbi:MAG TPA: sulfatase [Thermoanaerobaculia bacterium]|nr:sulfatase [Thermoanaerobaculia bacterium]
MAPVGFARRLALVPALIAAILVGFGCRKNPADAYRGMNVIWISFDSVRADHCSFDGYARKTTPNLDALAARGVRFPRTVAQAPYTLPSYASMLTSRYVAELAVHEQRDEKDSSKVLGVAPGPSPQDELVSEALRGAGYRTAAFVQSWISGPFGFDQGWDLFRHAQESLSQKMPHVLDWIERNRGGRFFVFLYATDTHYPFLHAHERTDLYGKSASSFEFTLDAIERVRAGKLHPTPDDLANAMAMYDEGLYWADQDLAPLFAYLDRAGLTQKTIVIFNADHGEEFDEHGVISHGQTYYDGVVRTPLVIAAPGLGKPGRAETALVQNLDVGPTILDLVGVERPRAWSGHSLLPAVLGLPDAASAPPRPAYTEGAWTFWIGSVVDGDRKFILVTPQERMLYDLAKDPGETSNLAGNDPDGVRTLYHALMKHLGGPSGWLAAGPDHAPSYETWMKQVMGHYGLGEQSDVVKELRSLGYLH